MPRPSSRRRRSRPLTRSRSRVDQLGATAQTAARRSRGPTNGCGRSSSASRPAPPRSSRTWIARRCRRADGRGAQIARGGRCRRRRASRGVGRSRRDVDRSDGADLPRRDDARRLGESRQCRRWAPASAAAAPMSPPSGMGGMPSSAASAILRSSRGRKRRCPTPRRSATASRSGYPTAAPRWRRTPWPPALFGTR